MKITATDRPKMLHRREFIASATALFGASASLAADAGRTVPARTSANRCAAAGKNAVREDLETPLAGESDVIVVGGGPAGIAAAVTAARDGAKVRLFELQGCLGGVWTSGMLTYLWDFNKSDFDREIIRRLEKYGAAVYDRTDAYDVRRNFVYEPEYMKFVCEDLCTEAGVKFTLQCPVVAAYRDGSGRNVETVVTESKSGRQAWRAKCFIDCSGDGDLAALAGCGYDLGYFKDGTGQPATLNALVVVRDAEALREYISNMPAMWDTRVKTHIPSSHAFRAVLRKTGLEPSYSDPTLWRLHGNLLALMANHEYRLPLDDAGAITAATVRARREIHQIVSRLDSLGGPWRGMRIAATAEQIGHREARRIHGRYTVTREDVARGATFGDALTKSRFGIDIHGLDLKANLAKAAGGNMGAEFKPFDIPLRACIARDADNLYMAGRDISGDFIAHASYRVTGSSVALGAGVGAAVARRIRRENIHAVPME
ncbi:MAG: FAD-dependent oxidoreductase [Kiritimatiellae bacterium]|nr:FAD-dependent oxidoreductase [Kiritimatiellia bacterium]